MRHRIGLVPYYSVFHFLQWNMYLSNAYDILGPHITVARWYALILAGLPFQMQPCAARRIISHIGAIFSRILLPVQTVVGLFYWINTILYIEPRVRTRWAYNVGLLHAFGYNHLTQFTFDLAAVHALGFSPSCTVCVWNDRNSTMS